jgi:hypothetical protein
MYKGKKGSDKQKHDTSFWAAHGPSGPLDDSNFTPDDIKVLAKDKQVQGVVKAGVGGVAGAAVAGIFAPAVHPIVAAGIGAGTSKAVQSALSPKK